MRTASGLGPGFTTTEGHQGLGAALPSALAAFPRRPPTFRKAASVFPPWLTAQPETGLTGLHSRGPLFSGFPVVARAALTPGGSLPPGLGPPPSVPHLSLAPAHLPELPSRAPFRLPAPQAGPQSPARARQRPRAQREG